MARRKKKKTVKSEPKKPLFNLEEQTKKGIWAVFFLAAAVVAVLSIWHKAGPFGELIFALFNYLFGFGYFILPLVFLMIAFEFLRSRRRQIYFTTVFGAALLFVSVLGTADLMFSNKVGLIGQTAALFFSRIFGFWAALVLLLSFALVSLLMALNISLKIGRDENEEDEEEEADKETDEALEISVNEAVSKAKEKPAPQTAAVPAPAPATFSAVKISRPAVGSYKPPAANLLEREEGRPVAGDIRANANIIKRTLQNFGIEVEMGEVNVGPTVTQYTLRPAQGVKLSKIVTLHNDLALALAAHPLRIEAPIPSKALVGIEVPNKSIALVRLGAILEDEQFKKSSGLLTFAVGRDVVGSAIFADLSKMPHLLIAGATGTGKSVSIHSLLMSLLWRNGPAQLKLILIDPKRVELAHYRNLPHLLTPVISDGKKSINALRWAVSEMERRYEMLSSASARDIAGYNSQTVKNKNEDSYLPYLVIVIDELADLMAAYGREVEGAIIRLAQMARAVGIHLVVSTQRPSVEVLTGLIKANLTTRIAFQVPSQVDSRTILDTGGAEKLLGNGDMLYLAGDASKPKRLQGVFVSEGEVKKTVDYIVGANGSFADDLGNLETGDNHSDFSPGPSADAGFDEPEDELFEEAKEAVIAAKKASASLLQRRLKVGYARAARLLDVMEERGIIGPGDGAKPREVYINSAPNSVSNGVNTDENDQNENF